MNEIELKELIMSRYSCRNYNGKEVGENTLCDICSLAKNSPSACNSQPWKMYISKKENKEKVIEALTSENRNLFLKNAGGFIALAEKKGAVLKSDIATKFPPNHFVKYDIGELTAYITLVAKSKGIDSCIIGWVDKEKIASALNIDNDYECNIVVSLGYSDNLPRAKVRKPESETIVK